MLRWAAWIFWEVYRRVLFSDVVVARLNGLQVTGSLGILLKLKAASHIAEIAPCLSRMRAQGIWLSADLQAKALLMAGESA